MNMERRRNSETRKTTSCLSRLICLGEEARKISREG